MKKFMAIMLTMLMVLSLALTVGCQKKEEAPAPVEAPAPAPAPEAPAASPAPEVQLLHQLLKLRQLRTVSNFLPATFFIRGEVSLEASPLNYYTPFPSG
jgi:hypothetical protein